MNTALALSFPPAAVSSVLHEQAEVDVDAQHQQLIRHASAINDTVLEELTPETLSIMSDLVEQFRTTLFRCQAAVTPQVDGGATG